MQDELVRYLLDTCATVAEAKTALDDASAELTFHLRDVDGVSTYSDPNRIGLGQR